MDTKRLDYTIFDKFKFERKPVGVKYSLKKPGKITQTDKSLAVCELFKEAQTGAPFYAVKENIQCGEHILGMRQFPPLMSSGALGRSFSMFKDARANRRVYDYIPVMEKDTVKYVSLASYDRMSFDPDLIIFTASTAQAEILLRASSFSSGKMWSSKNSTCLACAWLFAYPYLTGELNYTVSGLGYSMKARQVLPEGLFIIAVPADLLPGLINDLGEMEWNPDWFSLGREGFIQRVQTSTEGLMHDYGLDIPRKSK